MPEQNWERAIAAVIDGDGVVRGTAFFVGIDVALTCDHVLAAASKGPVSLKPVGATVTEAIIGEDRDEDLDLALVRVPGRPNRTWLALSSERAMIGRDIFSRGFPRDRLPSRYPDGFPMDPSRVSGDVTLVWHGQPVQMLVLDADVQRGMSGAPAVDLETDAVVGILRFREGEKHALAIPTNAATRRWPGLLEQPAPSFLDLTAAIPEALARTDSGEWDPALLHCLVVGSEGLATGEAEASLGALVMEVFSSPNAKALWDSFTGAWQGRELLRSRQRHLPAAYSKANVSLTSLDVVDAYASPASLDRMVQLLVQSDLALFDVTGFEPGVMLLLGVRAATRRGVTINSHGGRWREGHPLNRPFNLSDLSLSSHTPLSDVLAGDDPRINRLIERACTGFDQLGRHPHYLDLPVYDALRQLGSQENAWASIPLEDEVLVLCSYDATYFPTWLHLRRQLKAALSAEGILTNVARLQDLATPQLVSQSLYERVRRCAGCVADWTGSSPSTFFELGVRLAVSPWSVVQIADENWFVKATGDADVEGRTATQVKRMQALLDPLLYTGADDIDIGTRIAQQLIEMRGRIQGSRGHRLRQIAAEALSTTEERLPHSFEQLRSEADALNHKGRIRDNVPQALFYEVKEIKEDQETAALERRLAAWFYLEHRIRAGRLDDTDERNRAWRELGELVASDLFQSDDEADQVLANDITQRLTVSALALARDILQTVTLYRSQGDAAARRGKDEEAKEAWNTGLSLSDKGFDALSIPPAVTPAEARSRDLEVATEAAELLGVRGGLLRRLGRNRDALENYRYGSVWEASRDLAQTYNRTNAIKLALIVGDRTVAQLHDELVSFRDALERRLSTDERAAEAAWLWADLGDVRLLLGDDQGAGSAYRDFAAKARTESPTATLAVLREIVDALEKHGDPDAARTAATLNKVEATIGAH